MHTCSVCAILGEIGRCICMPLFSVGHCWCCMQLLIQFQQEQVDLTFLRGFVNSVQDKRETIIETLVKMGSFSSPLFQSLVTVAIPLAVMVGLVHSGMFDTLKIETGFEHYAEPADSHLGPIPFPECIQMPANSIVNVGYVAVAFFWGVYVFVSNSKLSAIQNTDAYLLYVMVWMLAFYGPVQLLRIVTQSHEWAVLDQWVTLPIFAWVLVMSKTMLTEWQPRLAAVTMMASIMSYNLMFTMEHGFEVALLPHVVYAVSSSWSVCCKYKPPGYHQNFALGVLMCAGFVVLKIADFHLARYPPFQELTGHFWSKVCDFLQAHFVFKVFTSVCLVRGTRNLAKKLF